MTMTFYLSPDYKEKNFPFTVVQGFVASYTSNMFVFYFVAGLSLTNFAVSVTGRLG